MALARSPCVAELEERGVSDLYTDSFERPLSRRANGWNGSIAHCRFSESSRSVEILLTLLVGVRR